MGYGWTSPSLRLGLGLVQGAYRSRLGIRGCRCRHNPKKHHRAGTRQSLRCWRRITRLLFLIAVGWSPAAKGTFGWEHSL